MLYLIKKNDIMISKMRFYTLGSVLHYKNEYARNFNL